MCREKQCDSGESAARFAVQFSLDQMKKEERTKREMREVIVIGL